MLRELHSGLAAAFWLLIALCCLAGALARLAGCWVPCGFFFFSA